MINIRNGYVEYNKALLPDWWKTGQLVRIVSKKDNKTFFVYKSNDKRVAKNIIVEDNRLPMPAKDGQYDVLKHSANCIVLIYNSEIPIDKSDINEEIKDIDLLKATDFEIELWIAKQTYQCLRDKKIPRGWGEAVRTFKDAHKLMQLNNEEKAAERVSVIKEIVMEEEEEKSNEN